METMKALVWSWLVVGVSLGTAVSAGGQTPAGALAIGRAARRPVRLGGRLRDRGGRAGGGVARVRRAVFGGADVRPVRGVCGRPGREQHGDRLGGIVCVGGRCAAGGVVGVLLARRVGVHGPGLGLQWPGGRGGAGSAPGPHGARSSWPCSRQASILAVRTVCSVRGRGRRFGTGSRRAGRGRQGIGTARRSRRCTVGANPGRQQMRAPRL